MPAIAIDTVVIGAGHAGLNTSRALQHADVDHVVLERGHVGETWRSQRWDSFTLNTPNWASALLDFDYDSDEPEGFMNTEALVAHLGAFAQHFDLPVREQTAVASVRRAGPEFEVRSDDGSCWRAAHVVVCSGSQNLPITPDLASDLPANVCQLHSAAYRSPEQLPVGAVLVVGGGQTGAQIAEELAQAGRDTYLCTSAVKSAPRRYRGRDVVTWIAEMGGAETRPDELQDPAERYEAQPLLSGSNGGHSVSLHSLGRRGVTLLGRLHSCEGARLAIGGELMAHAELGLSALSRVRDGIDRFIASSGLAAPDPEPDEALVAFDGIEQMAAIRELDLGERGISTVVWATGFSGDFSYLELDLDIGNDGAPVHSDGVSPVPGLYYVGFPWLRTRASGLILGTPGDALAVSNRIVARSGLQESSEMLEPERSRS